MLRHGVSVRAAGPEDVDVAVALSLLARGESAVGAQLCSPDPERLRTQVGTLLSAPGAVVLIGEVDDEPAGMLLGRMIGPSVFADAASLAIEAVYVRPSDRRRGLGHGLLASAAQLAEQAGAAEVFAATLPGARGMHRFLAQLGFAPAAAHRVVSTSTLQRRLAGEVVAGPVPRRAPGRGLEDLIARRRRARSAGRESATTAQAGSIPA